MLPLEQRRSVRSRPCVTQPIWLAILLVFQIVLFLFFVPHLPVASPHQEERGVVIAQPIATSTASSTPAMQMPTTQPQTQRPRASQTPQTPQSNAAKNASVDKTPLVQQHASNTTVQTESPIKFCANVIASRNTPGLLGDAALFSELMGTTWRPPQDSIPPSYVQLAHEVCDNKPHPANVTVHIQDFNYCYAQNAANSRQWMSLNHEWPPNNTAFTELELVICKTREGVRTATQLRSQINATFKIFYALHTSRDVSLPGVSPDYTKFIHVAGKSPQKHTVIVIATWFAHPEFPLLTVFARGLILKQLKKRGLDLRNLPSNVRIIKSFVDDATLQQAITTHGVHICPSEVEGFGHYINEARSVSAVVITTNGAPMNELVEDGVSGVLVEAAHSVPETRRWGGTSFVRHLVSIEGLAGAVERVLAMPIGQREAIGKRARQRFEQEREEFRRRVGLLREFACGGSVAEEEMGFV